MELIERWLTILNVLKDSGEKASFSLRGAALFSGTVADVDDQMLTLADYSRFGERFVHYIALSEVATITISAPTEGP